MTIVFWFEHLQEFGQKFISYYIFVAQIESQFLSTPIDFPDEINQVSLYRLAPAAKCNFSGEMVDIANTNLPDPIHKFTTHGEPHQSSRRVSSILLLRP